MLFVVCRFVFCSLCCSLLVVGCSLLVVRFVCLSRVVCSVAGDRVLGVWCLVFVGCCLLFAVCRLM